MTMSRRRLVFLLCFISSLILRLFPSSALPSVSAASKRHYIVYMGGHSSRHSNSATEADLHAVTTSHHDILATYLGDIGRAREAIRYSYTRHINGFTAVLNEEEAALIAKHPRVVSVFPDRSKKLRTTHSWNFMLLENEVTDKGTGKLVARPSALWKNSKFGEDVIIANIDGGVWPESQSFSDEGYGPVPSRWKGTCDESGIPCNRKLIGARYFSKGVTAIADDVKVGSHADLYSARDFGGHGTHTLSTAGGNFVPRANFSGAALGVAKGGSPRARVASYKTCFQVPDECMDSDILAAFESAISDGVDILSVSLGDDVNHDYFDDGMAIGAFHAERVGISVVVAGGNAGLAGLGSVSNLAPWMFTIAASTIDRSFETYAELRDGLRIKGASMSEPLPEHKFYPLIWSAKAGRRGDNVTNALLCKPGSLDPTKVKGKIVACLRGENMRTSKSMEAARTRAVGMILCNDKSNENELSFDPHFIPTVHIGYKDGLKVFKYINGTKNPEAYITGTLSRFGAKPAPAVCYFSSRGPNVLNPEIMKPDVTAPGDQILAAFSMNATNEDTNPDDPRRFPYQFESGTSMATPHVAGIVGLIKAVHPDWSPSAIRSAIMTTARTRDNTGNRMTQEGLDGRSDPFAYGSGHVRPNRAANPGLVYDLSTDDYLDFLCSLGYNTSSIDTFERGHKCSKSPRWSVYDFNYPSFSIPKLGAGPVTLTRKVKNVGPPGSYSAQVREPYGVAVKVVPDVLKFEKYGEEKSFKMMVAAKWKGAAKGNEFGGLTWTDGVHYVRSPIFVTHDLNVTVVG